MNEKLRLVLISIIVIASCYNGGSFSLTLLCLPFILFPLLEKMTIFLEVKDGKLADLTKKQEELETVIKHLNSKDALKEAMGKR